MNFEDDFFQYIRIADILDDISNRMERTVTGLQRGTDQINVFSRKEATCGNYLLGIERFYVPTLYLKLIFSF